jgi:hypothetical protein
MIDDRRRASARLARGKTRILPLENRLPGSCAVDDGVHEQFEQHGDIGARREATPHP